MDFWEEQNYIKAKQRFDAGKIWEKLVTDYNNFTDKQIHQFYEQFEQLKNYGDKLKFWKEKRLSPVKLQYTFKLQIENHPKEETIALSLEPIGNDEKKEYLSWAIEQCYENFKSNKHNYGFDTVLLEDLKERFRGFKGVLSTNIKDEISKTKLRIKKTGLDSDVYAYLTYRKSEPNILSDLNIDTYNIVVSLQYFAIKVAFVYDFLEYLLFLENCKIENRIPKSNTKHLPFTDKSFKAKENIDLKDLYDFLVTNEYIEDTGYDKFKNVFTEVIIKEEIKEDKIN